MDVGFTVTSYDGERIARSLAEVGVVVRPEVINATEARLRAELRSSTFVFRPDEHGREAAGARLFRRILELALEAEPGPPLGGEAVADAAAHVWARHLESNAFRRVLPGVPAALEQVRAAGLRLAIVSNSEGTVEAMLAEVGLRPFFETVVDSWAVGVAKPNPRIFEVALSRLGAAAEEAMMVGDSPEADVDGAAAAGVRGVLIDAYDVYPAHAGPRFRSFPSFVTALLGTGREPRS